MLGPGLGAVLETVRYTTDYQASRPHPFARLSQSTQRYVNGLLDWRHLPALVLAALALLPRLSWRWRTAAALGIPVVLAAAAWAVAPPEPVSNEPLGLYSSTYAMVLLAFLAGPVMMWAHRIGDRDLRLLLVLAVPTALVGVVTFAMTTSASIHWGAPVPPTLSLLGAVGAGLVLWAGRHGGRILAVAAVLALVGSLLALHPLRSFRDGAPAALHGPVVSGPMAGLHTRASQLERDGELRGLIDTWVGPSDGVFFYSLPGAYAYTENAMQTNLIWLSAFGSANERTVRWWQETGRFPDVAVVAKVPERAAGGWDTLVAADPLLAFLQEHYHLHADAPRGQGDAYVFRATEGTSGGMGEAPGWGCPPGG